MPLSSTSRGRRWCLLSDFCRIPTLCPRPPWEVRSIQRHPPVSPGGGQGPPERAGGGSQVSCRALPVDRMRYGLPELSVARDHAVSASSRKPWPCPFHRSQLSSVGRPHVETPNDGSFLPCAAVAMALGHCTAAGDPCCRFIVWTNLLGCLGAFPYLMFLQTLATPLSSSFLPCS